MKKLGENVFQFPLNWGTSGPIDLVMMFWPFLIVLFIMTEWIGLYHGILAVLLGIILFIAMVVPSVLWAKTYWRNFKKHGLILDMDKGIVSIYKWSWRLPQKFLEIPLAEIKGLGVDHKVNVNSKGSVSHKYDLVFHGKFGSRRVYMNNEDDWNLFQSLISDADA